MTPRQSLDNLLESIGVTVCYALFGLLWAWVMLLCWNATMPQIFNLPEISYWQGYALMILSRALLGLGYTPVLRKDK